MAYGDRFLGIQAFLNVLRHEEVERLIHQILPLFSGEDDKDWPLYDNAGDEMTQQQVWNMALSRALEVLEGRLELLGESD